MLPCPPVGLWSPPAAMLWRLAPLSLPFLVPVTSGASAPYRLLRALPPAQLYFNTSRELPPGPQPGSATLRILAFLTHKTGKIQPPASVTHVMLLPLSGWISRACRPPRRCLDITKNGGGRAIDIQGNFHESSLRFNLTLPHRKDARG